MYASDLLHNINKNRTVGIPRSQFRKMVKKLKDKHEDLYTVHNYHTTKNYIIKDEYVQELVDECNRIQQVYF